MGLVDLFIRAFADRNRNQTQSDIGLLQIKHIKLMEILKREQALANAESQRVELSKNSLTSILTSVIFEINEAVKAGKTNTSFVASKQFKTIPEVKAFIEPKLTSAGYSDFEITSAKCRSKVWISINFEEKK